MKEANLSQRYKQAKILPALGKTTQSRIFDKKSVLDETKKAFLDRFQKQSQNIQQMDGITSYLNRPLIQLSKQDSESFTPFKLINKREGNDIVSGFKEMRSQSTQLKPLIKVEIVSNEHQYHQITNFCNRIQTQEREKVRKRIRQLTPPRMNKEVRIKSKSIATTKKKHLESIKLYLNQKVYQRNLFCYKPYIDYDCMPIHINDKIYFFGGRKHTPIVTYEPASDRWAEAGLISQLKPFGECKGSMISNEEVLFFGGMKFFQHGMSIISNRISIVNVRDLTVEFQDFSSDKVPLRAFHSQCTYGKFIIISGGIGHNNNLLNDFMAYNFDKKYWCQLTIDAMPSELEEGFAKHKMVPIFHKRGYYSINDNEMISQYNPHIREEGVYIFGGENPNANLLGGVFLLKLGQSSLIMEELAIRGEGPLPRKNAQMIYYKEYIIIHGGRNDQMSPFVLESMHFLHLRRMEWIQVKGERAPGRYCHAMMVSGGEIVILGGKNGEGLCKQVYSLPFDERFECV